jgi:SRSO17 transposase
MVQPAVPVWLARLTTWLEAFEPLFGHSAQRGGLRRCLEGLRSDGRLNSMATMSARVRDPGTDQALNYFLTDAVWRAEALCRQLRAVLPVRSGILILDGTVFLKPGEASVGVSRQ